MTAEAVPILFVRACRACVFKSQGEMHLCTIKKVKEVLLLSDGDLKNVASVPVASPYGGGPSSSSEAAQLQVVTEAVTPFRASPLSTSFPPSPPLRALLPSLYLSFSL